MQESVWIWLFLLEVDSEHGCPFLKVEGYYDHMSKEQLVFLIPMPFWPAFTACLQTNIEDKAVPFPFLILVSKSETEI